MKDVRSRLTRAIVLGSLIVITSAYVAIASRAFWLAVIGLFAAISLWREALIEAMPMASEVHDAARKAPVLLLRSFADEEVKFSSLSWNAMTLERLIAEYFNAIGPVIKVPAPGDTRRGIGAYKTEPLSDDRWRDGVREKMREASVIIALVGRTPGIKDELIMLSNDRALGKTRLFFPPVAADEVLTRWESFNGLVQHVPSLAPLTEVDYRTLRAAYFDAQSNLADCC